MLWWVIIIVIVCITLETMLTQVLNYKTLRMRISAGLATKEHEGE